MQTENLQWQGFEVHSKCLPKIPIAKNFAQLIDAIDREQSIRIGTGRGKKVGKRNDKKGNKMKKEEYNAKIKKQYRKNNAKSTQPKLHDRNKVISIRPGERMLKIASLNPDTMNNDCINQAIIKMQKTTHSYCLHTGNKKKTKSGF